MRRSLTGLALAMVLPLPLLTGNPARADVVVQPGETLSELAARHGVSLNRLMQANGITNPDLVIEGQRLTLPGGGQPSAAGGSRATKVTVQPGETLSDIASRHGLSLNRLMDLNGISDPDLVFVGQRLVLGGSSRATAVSAAAAQPTAPYTVQSGETLSDIASRFGTSTELLMQLNDISNPDLVWAGTRLAVPGRAAATPRGSSSTARPQQHVVQPGENLSTIADRYGMSVERLISINNITDPDLVWAGSPLKLQAPPAPRPAPRAAAPSPRPKAKPKPMAQPPAPSGSKGLASGSTRPAAKPSVQAAATPAASSRPAPSTTTATTATRTTAASAATSAQAAAAVRPAGSTAASASTSTASNSTATPSPGPSSTASSSSLGSTATRATTMRTAATTTSTSTLRQAAVQPTSTTVAAATTAPAGTRRSSLIERSSVATRSTNTNTNTNTVASRAASASRSGNRTPAADWRRYGPLQVDWANWQSMGGSYVAPTLNGNGQGLYLAVNCSARKLNATSQSGQWKSWDSPQTDFEQRLINDLCQAKGS